MTLMLQHLLGGPWQVVCDSEEEARQVLKDHEAMRALRNVRLSADVWDDQRFHLTSGVWNMDPDNPVSFRWGVTLHDNRTAEQINTQANDPADAILKAATPDNAKGGE